MLCDVHVYGKLADICGDTLRLDIATASEAVQAICVNFPEAANVIRDESWTLFRGDEKEVALGEEAIALLNLGGRSVHIMPEAIGAKEGNGILKVVLGVTLIALSFGSAAFLSQPIAGAILGQTTWGNAIGQIGVVMALSGVSQMMAPEKNTDEEETKESFVFSGPRGTVGQGNAVPVIYGEVITSGVLVSAGVDAEDMLPVEDNGTIEPGNTAPTFPRPALGQR
jgi:predicted phage tail protein